MRSILRLKIWNTCRIFVTEKAIANLNLRSKNPPQICDWFFGLKFETEKSIAKLFILRPIFRLQTLKFAIAFLLSNLRSKNQSQKSQQTTKSSLWNDCGKSTVTNLFITCLSTTDIISRKPSLWLIFLFLQPKNRLQPNNFLVVHSVFYLKNIICTTLFMEHLLTYHPSTIGWGVDPTLTWTHTLSNGE